MVGHRPWVHTDNRTQVHTAFGLPRLSPTQVLTEETNVIQESYLLLQIMNSITWVCIERCIKIFKTTRAQWAQRPAEHYEYYELKHVESFYLRNSSENNWHRETLTFISFFHIERWTKTKYLEHANWIGLTPFIALQYGWKVHIRNRIDNNRYYIDVTHTSFLHSLEEILKNNLNTKLNGFNVCQIKGNSMSIESTQLIQLCPYLMGLTRNEYYNSRKKPSTKTVKAPLKSVI